MDFRLRPAEPSDLEFIWRLRVATMKAAIEAAYGWHEATQRGYAEESMAGTIVLIGEEPVGVLTLADWGDQLHLAWTREANKPLTLQVLQGNPAVALYERCGFVTYGHNGPHKLLMRWQPSDVRR